MTTETATRKRLRKGEIGECPACGRVRSIWCRGLCQCCYKNIAIRNRYRPQKRGASHREPTEAELDAMIARQMKDLPDWWNGPEEA